MNTLTSTFMKSDREIIIRTSTPKGVEFELGRMARTCSGSTTSSKLVLNWGGRGGRDGKMPTVRFSWKT